MGVKLSNINRGRALEAVVPISQMGVVILDKMGANVKWLPGGKTVCRKGPVDWIGTIVGSGRAICFDTKMSDSEKGFYWRSHVEAHQEEYLSRHGRAGAVAGLLIEATHPLVRRFYWCRHETLSRHVFDRQPCIVWAQMVDLGDTLHNIKFERVPGVR